MSSYKEVELFVTIDADGDYEASIDGDAVGDLYSENIGGNSERRTYRLRVMLPLPTIVEFMVTGVEPAEQVAGAVTVEPQGE